MRRLLSKLAFWFGMVLFVVGAVAALPFVALSETGEWLSNLGHR